MIVAHLCNFCKELYMECTLDSICTPCNLNVSRTGDAGLLNGNLAKSQELNGLPHKYRYTVNHCAWQIA